MPLAELARAFSAEATSIEQATYGPQEVENCARTAKAVFDARVSIEIASQQAAAGRALVWATILLVVATLVLGVIALVVGLRG